MFYVKLRETGFDRLWIVVSYTSYSCMGYVKNVTNVLHSHCTNTNDAIRDDSGRIMKERHVQQDLRMCDTEQ